MIKAPKIGDKVYWTDSDDNLCSGPGKIIEIKPEGGGEHEDMVISLRMDSGGETQCLPHELRRI